MARRKKNPPKPFWYPGLYPTDQQVGYQSKLWWDHYRQDDFGSGEPMYGVNPVYGRDWSYWPGPQASNPSRRDLQAAVDELIYTAKILDGLRNTLNTQPFNDSAFRQIKEFLQSFAGQMFVIDSMSYQAQGQLKRDIIQVVHDAERVWVEFRNFITDFAEKRRHRRRLAERNPWLEAWENPGNPYMTAPFDPGPVSEMGGYAAPVQPYGGPNIHGLIQKDVKKPKKAHPPSLKKGAEVLLVKRHGQRNPTKTSGKIIGKGKKRGTWNVRWSDNRLSKNVPTTKLAVSNPGWLMVINPSKKGKMGAAANFEALFGRKPSSKELASYTKAYNQHVTFHGTEPDSARKVEVPAGSSPFLVGVGEMAELNYTIPWDSERGGTYWTHKAGDHGKSKGKTDPAWIAADPKTGLPLIAQDNQSKLHFKPTHGLMG